MEDVEVDAHHSEPRRVRVCVCVRARVCGAALRGRAAPLLQEALEVPGPGADAHHETRAVWRAVKCSGKRVALLGRRIDACAGRVSRGQGGLRLRKRAGEQKSRC